MAGKNVWQPFDTCARVFIKHDCAVATMQDPPFTAYLVVFSITLLGVMATVF